MKIINKIINGIFFTLSLLLILMIVYFSIVRMVSIDPLPKIMGYAGAIVLSGSMSPEIEVNDLIVVREQDSYEVNDIVTYYTLKTPVTHRIIEKTQDGFVTKGDANTSADEPILEEQIAGEVILVIPAVGYITEFLQSPLGTFCLLLAGFLLIAAPRFAEKRRNSKRKDDNDFKEI